MNKQPEALHLADELDVGDFDVLTNYEAAAELRRLHEVNQELLEALKEVLAAERFSNRPPETVMQAEEKLTRIRAATAKAEAAITKAGKQP